MASIVSILARRFSIWCWAAALAAAGARPPAAWAAEPPLTLEDCLREAAAQNADVRAAQAEAQRARADFYGQIGAFLPQVSLDGQAGRSGTETDDDTSDATMTVSDSYQVQLQASQTLFTGFRDSATLARSRFQWQIARFQLQQAKADLGYTVKTAFAQTLYAQDLLGLVATIAVRRQDNVSLVQLRFEAGREHQGSALRIQAYARQAAYEVAQARRALAVAQRTLAAALGRAEPSALSVTGAWSVATPPEPPRFADVALLTPTHAQAVAQWRAAREGVRIADSYFYPAWSVYAGASRQGERAPPERDAWNVGTAVSWPLFVGGQYLYGRRAAAAEQRVTEASLQSTDRQLTVTLEQAFVTWQNAAEGGEVQAAFLQAAEVRAEIARGQYANGLISFEDWDLIENDLIAQQKTMLETRRQAVAAEAAWEKATGTAPMDAPNGER